MDSQTATEAPAVGTSSVPLPPAALRLENLEFDATGNPYYKFPPFLSPPHGVTLIPFEKFKPHGIQIALDSDEEELDGEGIPTVELAAKHNTNEKDKKRKKKTKDDEPRKSSPWWDDWAEGEDLRRASVFDPNIPRAERFCSGAAEFAQNRKFSPMLRSLYDHFRHFSGLLTDTRIDKYGKGSDGGEADNEDDDDEAELNAEEAAAEQEVEIKPYPEPVIDVDSKDEHPRIREVDDDSEEKDLQMDAFLNDPETSIKIFFSSFYMDKGLMWSESKRRDGPILLSFFLAFFVRNRIMPDYQRAFVMAHRVAEKARVELPQTATISMSLPDVFGRACTALWGEKRNDGWSDMDVDVSPFPTSADSAQVLEPDSDSIQAPASAPEWEAQMQEHGFEKVEVDSILPDTTVPNGWGEPASKGEEMVGGWGDGATVLQGDSMNPWGAPQDTADWTTGEPVPSLLHILGPTTLPLTHVVQRAEQATRQIVTFAPPRADATGLERVLGTVVLAPWKKYWKETAISPPEMLVDCAEAAPFDPGRDLIRAFVSPETIDVLREGMGLKGIFVQVVRTDVPKEKKSKSRRGKAKSADDMEWWYIEFIYEVIPSFWAEAGVLE